MKKYLLVIFLFGFKICFGQVTFETAIGGINTELAYSIVQTNDGGYAVCGQTNSYGYGGNDVYVVKLDSNGNVLWSKAIGGAGEDFGYAIIETYDGSLVVSGTSTSFGAGNDDTFIIKLSANGTIQWTRAIGGTSDDSGGIIETNDKGFAYAGATTSFGEGGKDFYIVKLDSTGNQQWSKTIGGSLNENAYGLSQTSDKGYIMGGYTYSYGAGNGDFYVVKLDSTGALLWTRTIGSSGADKCFSQIFICSDGGYVMTGYTTSFGAGSYDIYAVKLDSIGNIQWAKAIGGTGTENGGGIIQSSDGGFVITSITTSFSVPYVDYYIVKLDSSGNLLWTKIIGGSNDNRPTQIIQSSDGDYVICGYTTSFGAGAEDFYIVKIDSSGNTCYNFGTGGTLVSGGTLNPTGGMENDVTNIETSFKIVGIAGHAVELICTTTNIENSLYGTNSINIYPNPAHTHFTISLNNGQWTIKNGQLKIYDMMGREVYQQGFDKLSLRHTSVAEPVEAVEVTVNCKLNAGVYFVRAGDAVQKLVVE